MRCMRGLAAALGRQVTLRQDPADVAQGDACGSALGRAFVEGRQFCGDPRRETAKLGPCQAQEFVDCQHSHCFLHRFSAAPIAAFWWRPLRRRRRVHRLRPERQRRSAHALAAMQPRNGASWPKEGRVWCGGMEEAGAGRDTLECVNSAPNSDEWWAKEDAKNSISTDATKKGLCNYERRQDNGER